MEWEFGLLALKMTFFFLSDLCSFSSQSSLPPSGNPMNSLPSGINEKSHAPHMTLQSLWDNNAMNLSLMPLKILNKMNKIGQMTYSLMLSNLMAASIRKQK